MRSDPPVSVAIVDYGVGNLFSIQQACRHVGMTPYLAANPHDIEAADVLVLPGVGAFGSAMATLRSRGFLEPLLSWSRAGRPLVGICLGFQLLFSESHEFGIHSGLGLIDGTVRYLGDGASFPRDLRVKIPSIGWVGIEPSTSSAWSSTPLEGLPCGVEMYFLHSYYASPADKNVSIAVSQFDNLIFCSAVQKGAIFGCQFHPERSGRAGLQIYANIRDAVLKDRAFPQESRSRA